MIDNLWGKLIIFAIWYVVWLVLFCIFCALIGWDSISNAVLGIVPFVLAVVCMTPLPKKFFLWLWEKIKGLFTKNA